MQAAAGASRGLAACPAPSGNKAAFVPHGHLGIPLSTPRCQLSCAAALGHRGACESCRLLCRYKWLLAEDYR